MINGSKDLLGCMTSESSISITSNRKRNIQDYFTAVPKKSRRTSDNACRGDAHISGTLNKACKELSIPGLQLIDSFVSVREEEILCAFLEAQSWRTDLSRRVIHYGGTYCQMPPRDATPEQRKQIESTIYKAATIPDEVEVIVLRMVEQGIYQPAQKPEYCIVNSYTANNGISAHVENFRFDSPVCGLTLMNGDWMRFHELVTADDGSVRSGKAAQAARTGRRIDVWMPRRSLLIMSGEARKKWQHEIVRGRRDRHGDDWQRISLTFRTLRKSYDSSKD